MKLSSGYLQLSGGTTSFGRFELSFRTHSSNAVLAQFGTIASLEVRRGGWRREGGRVSMSLVTIDGCSLQLHYGTVVYRRSDRFHTLLADAFANDGLWHRVTLMIDNSVTQVGG